MDQECDRMQQAMLEKASIVEDQSYHGKALIQ